MMTSGDFGFDPGRSGRRRLSRHRRRYRFEWMQDL